MLCNGMWSAAMFTGMLHDILFMIDSFDNNKNNNKTRQMYLKIGLYNTMLQPFRLLSTILSFSNLSEVV